MQEAKIRPNSTHTTRSKHCTTVWGERNTLFLRATRGPSILISRLLLRMRGMHVASIR